MAIEVQNRSTGTVVYELPELNTRRVFNLGETKRLEPKELEALYQQDGGKFLIENYLLVKDRDWVAEHFEAPIEYWWEPEEIKASIINDDLELFSETLDYAPEGVIDFIKMFSWQIPLSDLNKISVINEKLGFDVLASISLMSENVAKKPEQKPQRRRRETIT